MKNPLAERIIELWNRGLTSNQIGRKLEITRNAVIGVVSRARSKGVYIESRPPRRPPKPVSSAPKEKKIVVARRFIPKETVMPIRVEPLIDRDPKCFSDLNRNECRFAVNNAERGEKHMFCSAPTKPGEWLCEHHRRIVYVPIKDYRREERERRNAANTGGKRENPWAIF